MFLKTVLPHFVHFEISREKGDFIKTTIGHLGLNEGSRKHHIIRNLVV